jgi:hypothetical protein
VIDDLNPAQGVAQLVKGVRQGKIAPDCFHAALGQAGFLVRRPDEAAHRIAALHQSADEMTANKTGPSRDEGSTHDRPPWWLGDGVLA